jgi:hypothetical protein
MITLPITDKELIVIMELLEKNKDKHKDLYAKLWSFKLDRKSTRLNSSHAIL